MRGCTHTHLALQLVAQRSAVLVAAQLQHLLHHIVAKHIAHERERTRLNLPEGDVQLIG